MATHEAPQKLWKALLEEHFALHQLTIDGRSLDFETVRREIDDNASRATNERAAADGATHVQRQIWRENACLAAVYARIHDDAHRVAIDQKPGALALYALCLSGGGIRSATLNLGVLQGLARCDQLQHCEYLSTVSGGGFIGSWLMAWVHRMAGGVETVDRLLEDGPSPIASPPACGKPAMPVGTSCPALRAERPEVAYLREYSNYLTPRIGLMSADTWALIATYLRNLLINWTVLMPLLLAGVMLAWGLIDVAALLAKQPASADNSDLIATVKTANAWLRWSGLSCLMTGIVFALAIVPRDERVGLGHDPLPASPARRWLPRMFVTIPIGMGIVLLALATPSIARMLEIFRFIEVG